MAHLLVLNKTSRFPLPAIGPFEYRPEYQRHVWKGAPLPDAAALAEAINEAMPWLKGHDNPFIEMRVMDAPEDPGAPTAPTVADLEALRAENGKLQATIEEQKALIAKLSQPPPERLKLPPKPAGKTQSPPPAGLTLANA